MDTNEYKPVTLCNIPLIIVLKTKNCPFGKPICVGYTLKRVAIMFGSMKSDLCY